jgi:hypothetical protein
MSRKVFTAGEVLAASDVNNFLMNQTVMSFSGTATRESSIPTPVEGMYTHLEDTDSLQFWNGSAWINGFGMNLITAQTIGSAVASVVVPNVFSAAYDNYRVIISGGSASSAINNINLQIGNAVTGYYGSRIQQVIAGTITGQGQSNTTSLEITRYSALIGNPVSIIDIITPFLPVRTGIIATGIFMDTTNGATRLSTGFLNNINSYTDFTLLASAGTITGGTVYVYGYRSA